MCVTFDKIISLIMLRKLKISVVWVLIAVDYNYFRLLDCLKAILILFSKIF